MCSSCADIFGASFAIKFLEHRETSTVAKYESLKSSSPPRTKPHSSR